MEKCHNKPEARSVRALECLAYCQKISSTTSHHIQRDEETLRLHHLHKLATTSRDSHSCHRWKLYQLFLDTAMHPLLLAALPFPHTVLPPNTPSECGFSSHKPLLVRAVHTKMQTSACQLVPLASKLPVTSVSTVVFVCVCMWVWVCTCACVRVCCGFTYRSS